MLDFQAKPFFYVLVIVLLVGGGIAALYFFGTSTKAISVTGVLRSSSLANPKRDYCSEGYYLDLLDQVSPAENSASLLVTAGSSANFSYSDLFTGQNKVYDATGVFKKGKTCSVKDSCACDDSIVVQSLKLNDVKNADFIRGSAQFEGTVKCFYLEGVTSCIPVLETEGGKVFELTDPGGTTQFIEGKRFRIWVSGFDQASSLGASISGTLYVGASKSLP